MAFKISSLLVFTELLYFSRNKKKYFFKFLDFLPAQRIFPLAFNQLRKNCIEKQLNLMDTFPSQFKYFFALFKFFCFFFRMSARPFGCNLIRRPNAGGKDRIFRVFSWEKGEIFFLEHSGFRHRILGNRPWRFQIQRNFRKIFENSRDFCQKYPKIAKN